MKKLFSAFNKYKYKIFIILILAGVIGIYDHYRYPFRDYQVDIDLTVDGKPVHLSRVLRCERHSRWNEGWGSHVTFSLAPDVRVFGQRLDNKNALIVWAPDACGLGNFKPVRFRNSKDGNVNDNWARRWDNRLAHINYVDEVPAGNLPMVGWIEDADHPDEILLYASPKAYENQKARIKVGKISMTNPPIWAPVSKPDEFAWLGTTEIGTGRDPHFMEAEHMGYALMPIVYRYPDRAQMFWSKVDKNNNEVQYIRLHPAPISAKSNADIEVAFGSGSKYYEHGGSLWSGWTTTKEQTEKSVLPSWIDGYPLRFIGDHFLVQMDMFGFVYVCDKAKIEKIITDQNPPVIFPDGSVINNAFGEVQVYYVPSLNNIFWMGGARFSNHKYEEGKKK